MAVVVVLGVVVWGVWRRKEEFALFRRFVRLMEKGRATELAVRSKSLAPGKSGANRGCFWHRKYLAGEIDISRWCAILRFRSWRGKRTAEAFSPFGCSGQIKYIQSVKCTSKVEHRQRFRLLPKR